MPPKKKKGAASKKATSEDGAPLSSAEEASRYQATCQSLQMQLADRTSEMSQIAEDKKTLEKKMSSLQHSLTEEHKAAFEITRDMTRQYKGMQEQLVDRITQLSRTVQDLEDKLEESQLRLEKNSKEKDSIIQLKDEEINQMKARMEDMANEFGGMLKQTLDKMRQRIEIDTSSRLDSTDHQ